MANDRGDSDQDASLGGAADEQAAVTPDTVSSLRPDVPAAVRSWGHLWHRVVGGVLLAALALLDRTNLQAIQLAWSPDGKHLAVALGDVGGPAYPHSPSTTAPADGCCGSSAPRTSCRRRVAASRSAQWRGRPTARACCSFRRGRCRPSTCWGRRAWAARAARTAARRPQGWWNTPATRHW
jgi:hypothetical protein